MKTKVLILEPSALIAEGLAQALQSPQLKVVATLAGRDDLDYRMSIARPDVVIANPTMGVTPADIRGDDRTCAVVALVYQYVRQAALRQYDAVIDVCDPPATILQTVLDAASSDPDSGARGIATHELTKREKAVLIEVAKGFSNKEIAAHLSVSIFTVTTHRKNIIRKTGIKSVAGLTVYALLNNLISEEAVI